MKETYTTPEVEVIEFEEDIYMAQAGPSENRINNEEQRMLDEGEAWE
jgi:hypothetical protein